MTTNYRIILSLLLTILTSANASTTPLPEFAAEQLVYFDETVKDQNHLLNAITSAYEVSIATDFHLITHGKPGHLYIQNEWLDAQGIVDFLMAKADFSKKEKLWIYGCNFAKGKMGQQALNEIISALHISVAASDDLTGVDGDWDLEVGSHEGILHPLNYRFNLQAPLAFGNPSLIVDVPSTDLMQLLQ